MMIGRKGRRLAPLTYLLAAAALLLSLGHSRAAHVTAQWVTSGSNISNTNTGNVGVGTATPGAKLDVGETTANATKSILARLDEGNTTGGGTFLGVRAYDTQPTFAKSFSLEHYFYGALNSSINFNRGRTTTGGFITFATNNGTERMRIDGAGNVGVGTVSPAYRLDVSGSLNASGLCLGGDCKTAWSQVGGGASQWTTAGTSIYYGGGNVGLGAASPTAKLQVSGGSAFITGDSGSLGIGAGSGLALKHTAGGSEIFGYDYANNASKNLLLQLPGGNVGIGTATPGSKLFVGSGVPAGATLAGVNVALGGNSYVSASNGTVNTFIGSDTSPYGVVGTLTNHPLGLRANNALAVTVMPDGKVGVGTATPASRLDVNGNVSVTGDITATGNIAVKYQDLAEWVPSREQLPPGTVVVLDAEQSNAVTTSSRSYDTRVAGVVSGTPGIILGEGGEGKVKVATTGRVLVKVDATKAPIKIGDLLVTSDLPGVAMKSEPMMIRNRPFHAPGTIVGKALQPLAGGVGEILVLLSLQ